MKRRFIWIAILAICLIGGEVAHGDDQKTSNVESSVEKLIQRAKARQKNIEKEYSLILKLYEIGDEYISREEKIKEWGKFIEKYPKRNHLLEKAKLQIKTLNNPRKEIIQIEQKTDSDTLSNYIKIVQKRVYGNWRPPINKRYDKLVVVNFTISLPGEIQKPTVEKSSDVPELDALAFSAVVKSAPFPSFPAGIFERNLNISIYFRYRPKEDE